MSGYMAAGLLSQLGNLRKAGEDGPIVDADPCGRAPADAAALERTRFFPRQLVGPDDFTTDQRYFRDKHRRHNRLLHGWGVVCGACVEPDPENPCAVVVTPGYVLGPWGDEIVIPHRVRVDLCQQDVRGDAVSPCGAGVDPWCSDVRVDRRADEPLYLAIRYAECDSRPVRVTSCGCGCDDSECEYSRTRDSYAIRVLDELPVSHAELSPIGGLYGLIWGVSCLGGKGRACPPCPDEPWVVLADVTLSDGQVTDVKCFEHRRYAASAAMFYFQCGTASGTSGLGALAGSKKSSTLMDVRGLGPADGEAVAPAPTVAVRLDGAWTSVPAGFAVEEGETVGTLLEREGDRELIDPGTGDVIRLRELYAAAAIDPSTPVRSAGDALVPLEGRRLDVTGLRAVRGSLGDLLGAKAAQRLDHEHAGAPGGAVELPAAELPAAAAEPRLAERLGETTIADLAAMGRDRFVAETTAELPEAERDRVGARAAEAWEAATRVVRLAGAWEETEAEGPAPREQA